MALAPVLLCGNGARSQDAASLPALQGVKRVSVTIRVSDGVKKAGIDEKHVEAFVGKLVGQLQLAAVARDAKPEPDGELEVSLNQVYGPSADPFAGTTQVRFLQRCVLVNEPKRVVQAATWETLRATRDPYSVKQGFDTDIAVALTQFGNACLAAERGPLKR